MSHTKLTSIFLDGGYQAELDKYACQGVFVKQCDIKNIDAMVEIGEFDWPQYRIRKYHFFLPVGSNGKKCKPSPLFLHQGMYK